MNSLPGRLVEVYTEGPSRMGVVEFDGRRRAIYLNLVPEAQTGDSVRFHAGFATELIGPDEALPDYSSGNRKPSLEENNDYRLLSQLDPQQLRKLIPLAEDRQFAAGRIIFPSGARSQYLHLIVSGDVALEATSGNLTTPVQTLHAGEAMGWSAFIGENLTRFQARALSPVSTIAFKGDRLREACDSDPALGYALLKRLTEVVTERMDAMRMKLLGVNGSAAGR